MKKIIAITIFVSFALSSFACEICGCGLGNYYIGLLPTFKHRFIGMRYHYGTFATRLTDDPTQFSNDRYQTLEIWGGWNVSKKVQLLAFIPYNFNHQVSDEGVTNLKGVGDIAVLMNYQLWNKTKNNITNQLYIGGGLKLPTGRFAIEEGDPDVAAVANTQRGSGSADALISLMHTIHFTNWGINTSAIYKLNTTNKNDYRFGNKFTGNSSVFYTARTKNMVWSPNIGLVYEHTGQSRLSKAKIDLTGGYLLQSSFGIEAGFGKIAAGINARLPLSQNFADGQTKSKLKTMVHVSFAI